MPVEYVQKLLKSIYGLYLGLGEITKILHTVVSMGKSEVEKLLHTMRGSPAVNADETGWREDGVNGYIWSFSTPDVRYFVRDRSLAGKVAERSQRTCWKRSTGGSRKRLLLRLQRALGRHQRC